MGVLAPDDFSGGGHQAEFTDIHLDHGSPSQDAQLRVHGPLRVLLDSDDGKLEGGLEFGVRDIGFAHAQAHWADEPFKFRRLPSKRLSNKGRLCDHPLPALLLALPRFDDPEDLGLGDSTNSRDRDIPLARLFLALLFDQVAQELGAVGRSLSVGTFKQISRQGFLSNTLDCHVILTVGILITDDLFVVLANGLAHLNIFDAALLVEHLCTESVGTMHLCRVFMGCSGGAFPRSFGVVQTTTMLFDRLVNVVVLRHTGIFSEKPRSVYSQEEILNRIDACIESEFVSRFHAFSHEHIEVASLLRVSFHAVINLWE